MRQAAAGSCRQPGSGELRDTTEGVAWRGVPCSLLFGSAQGGPDCKQSSVFGTVTGSEQSASRAGRAYINIQHTSLPIRDGQGGAGVDMRRAMRFRPATRNLTSGRENQSASEGWVEQKMPKIGAFY